ncbi:hypothetical protein ACFLSE_08735 [Bacteroidota bacterium]
MIVTINGRETYDDPNESTSFTAEKGEHTYRFIPETELCYFSGSILGYQYNSSEAAFNIDSDSRIEITTFLILFFKE